MESTYSYTDKHRYMDSVCNVVFFETIGGHHPCWTVSSKAWAVFPPSLRSIRGASTRTKHFSPLSTSVTRYKDGSRTSSARQGMNTRTTFVHLCKYTLFRGRIWNHFPSCEIRRSLESRLVLNSEIRCEFYLQWRFDATADFPPTLFRDAKFLNLCRRNFSTSNSFWIYAVQLSLCLWNLQIPRFRNSWKF